MSHLIPPRLHSGRGSSPFFRKSWPTYSVSTTIAKVTNLLGLIACFDGDGEDGPDLLTRYLTCQIDQRLKIERQGYRDR